MVEVSNAVLSVLVLAVLAGVLITTVSDLGDTGGFFSVIGFATTDTGYVNLSINQTLAIAVDATNSSILFGGCVPRGGASYWCATNDSAVCSGNNALGNCSGDTTSPQFIRVDNVGNIDANVTVQSECDADDFIGGTSPLFEYITTHCNGTAVSSWTSLSSLGTTDACTNVSYLGGQLRLYANVTIPQNAVGGVGGCSDQSTLTFSAVQAGS